MIDGITNQPMNFTIKMYIITIIYGITFYLYMYATNDVSFKQQKINHA